MKAMYILLAVGLIATVSAYPGARRDSSESTESDSKEDGMVLVIPRSHKSIFDDFGSSSSGSSSSSNSDEEHPSIWHPFRFRFDSNPFDSFVSKMQETMNRMRAQMAAALAGQLGHGLGLTPWGKVPEGANTTSTTKIIDNHKVTINETTYTDGDENSGVIYRVRVIDVKPLNETVESVSGSSSTDMDTVQTSQEVDKASDRKEQTTPSVEPLKTSEAKDREELTTQSPIRGAAPETIGEFDNEIPKSQIEILSA